MKKKSIAILGSTGSIGTQALEVIAANRNRLEVSLLTANNNAELLIEQAIAFQPRRVVIGNVAKYTQVSEALRHQPVEVLAGCDIIADTVADDHAETVLTAMVGSAGLQPTVAAIRAGKNIALANKETLVVAGDIITRLAEANHVAIYPVDSEHSAIFQCLAGEDYRNIEKIILTASGGPFRQYSHEQLQHVTRQQALNHPNWCMGTKITIDSATLMNKGLEAIEARWLFGATPEAIEIVVHPQSIIHSMVQFVDGSIKAQMGLPDMKLPIQYAFTYPDRWPSAFPRFDFARYPQLTFEAPDTSRFRCIALAYEAMKKGGNQPCIMNAANEVAVEAFLSEKISFTGIPDLIGQCMYQLSFINKPTLEDLTISDTETRIFARSLLKNL